MPLFRDVILRGTRASQPLATVVPIGTLYSVTDESNLIERSNGSSWDAYSGSGGGGASPLTTKGDLYTYTTVDARLPVGSNGQVLSANSATSTGLEWVPSSSGLTQDQVLNRVAFRA